jgi:hypothetical protein
MVTGTKSATFEERLAALEAKSLDNDDGKAFT